MLDTMLINAKNPAVHVLGREVTFCVRIGLTTSL